GRPFHRSAVFNRRTWPLEHLTIGSLRIRWSSESHPAIRRQFIPIFGPPPPQTYRFNQLWKWYKIHLADHHADLRDGGLGDGADHLGAVPDDALPLDGGAHHEPGNVGQEQQRHAEGIAELDEPGGLVG